MFQMPHAKLSPKHCTKYQDDLALKWIWIGRQHEMCFLKIMITGLDKIMTEFATKLMKYYIKRNYLIWIYIHICVELESIYV